jgi:glycosyltransferase involved in cell wall biosynthesis
LAETSNISVLWLPNWYPNQLDPYNGDFIQRHARATALYCKVDVICIVRDKEGKVTRSVKTEKNVSGNLNETIIYYYSNSFLPGIADRILSGLKYMRIYKKSIREYINQNGKPRCAHVHIADKNGLIAIWLKRTLQIPYLVSEQWTLFLQEAIPQFHSQSLWFRRMWKRVITNASGISVVSDYLGKALVSAGAPDNYKVIPNVVDHQIFYPAGDGPQNVSGFIHISLLNYQKNFIAILKAFELVKMAGHAFHLSVYGPVSKTLQEKVKQADLSKEVQFHGEVAQTILADRLRNSIALIQYSRYETFGCVIIEAHASGIPVIASEIPVHHETIVEGQNGVFVESENAKALADTIITFLKNRPPFSPKEISERTKKLYGYDKVGKTFYEWYQSLT